jgi:hypothetical protein
MLRPLRHTISFFFLGGGGGGGGVRKKRELPRGNNRERGGREVGRKMEGGLRGKGGRVEMKKDG